jgi:uncharacterized repeat protein (TIGR01451 family)
LYGDESEVAFRRADHQAGPAFVYTGGNALGLDIRANSGSWTINGACWQGTFLLSSSTGTGVINPFLSFQASPEEHGFNTDANPMPFDNTRSNFTDPLPLNIVPIFTETVGGGCAGVGPWREFILDGNESNSTPDFSIDALKVWVCKQAGGADPRTYTPTELQAAITSGECTQVYTIPAGQSLHATTAHTSGSGNRIDYRFLIPASNFPAQANTDCPYNDQEANPCGWWVVLYSHMGDMVSTDATFEEFSTIRREVPPNLTIVKTPDGQTVAAGNPITFSIVVGNNGGSSATNVVLSDPLPNPNGASSGINWSIQSQTAGSNCTIGGAVPNQTLNCAIGTLAVNATRTIVVTSPTTGQSCAVYDNTASVSADNDQLSPKTDDGQITVNNCFGSVRIVKTAVGGNATFSFTHNITSNPVVGSPFDITTVAGTGQQNFLEVPVGNYSATESAPPAGWQFTSVACTIDGGAAPGAVYNQGARSVTTLPVQLGKLTICTFTNTKDAKLIVRKEVTAGSDQSTVFTFTPTGWNGGATFPLSHGQEKESEFLAPGATNRDAVETIPTGWDLTNRVCVHAAGSTQSAGTSKTFTSITNGVRVQLAAGEVIRCTFTNRQRGTITLLKEEVINGVPQSPLSRPWEFQIRTGASTLSSGITRASGTADVGTGVVNFSCVEANNSGTPPEPCRNDGGVAYFVPGSYFLCEVNMPVNTTNNIPSPPGFTPDAEAAEGADNGNECWPITIDAGTNGPGGILNTPNPIVNTTFVGTARTIGYWRNWSSCTKGNQYAKALANGEWDATLDGNLPQTIGLLVLNGPAGPNQALSAVDCQNAVNILSKRSLDGTMRANDAAYALASQFLAAKLNYTAGALQQSCATTAMASAQTLLSSVSPTGVQFLGTTSYMGPQSGHPARGQALILAGLLDAYNNNEPNCGQ